GAGLGREGEGRGGAREGPAGEEALGAKANLPRPAADDVPADTEHGIQENEEAHRLEIRVPGILQRDRIDEGQEQERAQSEPRSETAARTVQRVPEGGTIR